METVLKEPPEDTAGTSLPALDAIGLDNFEPYLMNRIMARYNASLRDDLREQGLSTPKMRSLAVLSVIDGPSISDLSIYAVVEVSTLSRALDSLEADGLVRRQPDDADSRSYRIHITGDGRAAFQRLWPTMAGQYQRMFKDIAPQDRAQFLATLHQILLNIREHAL